MITCNIADSFANSIIITGILTFVNRLLSLIFNEHCLIIHSNLIIEKNWYLNTSFFLSIRLVTLQKIHVHHPRFVVH